MMRTGGKQPRARAAHRGRRLLNAKLSTPERRGVCRGRSGSQAKGTAPGAESRVTAEELRPGRILPPKLALARRQSAAVARLRPDR